MAPFCGCALDEPLSSRSGSAVGVWAADKVVVRKSNAVPGVFGVFAAEPNDANAPDPSPNADAPPGEDTPDVFSGGIALNWFERPGVVGSFEEKRLEVEKPLE